jgi:hypothetical protein
MTEPNWRKPQGMSDNFEDIAAYLQTNCWCSRAAAGKTIRVQIIASTVFDGTPQ